MKKIFLSLALALLLILPLMFVACDTPEEPSSSSEPEPLPPEPEMIEVPSEELFASMVAVDQKTASSVFYKTSISKADYVYDYEEFILVRKDTYSTEDPIVLLSQAYTFISKLTAKTFSYTVNSNISSDNDNFATTITNIYYDYNDYNDGLFEITVQYGDDTKGKVDFVVYNVFGEKVIEKLGFKNEDKLEEMLDKDYELSDLSDELSNAAYGELSYIPFDGAIYLVNKKDLTVKKVFDPYKESPVAFMFGASFYWDNETELFTAFAEDDEKGIYSVATIDKELKLASYSTFAINKAATDLDLFPLSNNNIIIVEITALPDDAADFDCYYDGDKTNFDVYLIDATSGEKKELDNSIIPTSKFSAPVDFELKDEKLNAFRYYELFDGVLINHKDLIVLDDEGKPVKTLNPFFALGDERSITVTQNGMLVYDELGTSHYIDATGKIIAPCFKNVQTSYNNLWLVTESNIDNTVNIYSSDLKLVYTLPEGTTLERVLNNSLILKKEVREPIMNEGVPTGETELVGYEYLLFKGDATSMTSLFVEKFVAPTEGSVKSFYYTAQNCFIIMTSDVVTGDYSYAIYDDLGESKATIGPNFQIISYVGYGDYGSEYIYGTSGVSHIIAREEVVNADDPSLNYYVYHIYFVNSNN